MESSNEDSSVLEPPRYDMLHIKFRGDTHEVVLPYCEVANGDIASVTKEAITIVIQKEEGKKETVAIPCAEFITVMEKTFDTKEIISLSVQMAGYNDPIKLL